MRSEPALLTDKARAVVKDKHKSLKKTGGSRSADHNRALCTEKKSSARKGKSKGGGNKSQKSATAHSAISKVQDDGGTTGSTGNRKSTNTERTGGKDILSAEKPVI